MSFPRSTTPCALLAAALLLIFSVLAPSYAIADSHLSAMEIFARLPVTLFEDTPEGLSDDERNQLVERGECAYWLVASESADSLVLLSRPFGETRVNLRVFRGGEYGFVAAIGTSTTPICALELWGQDSTGGLIPLATPTEPPLTDFFEPGYRLPRNISPVKLFCLADDALVSRPLFWGPEGLMNITPTRNVRYVWQDGAFKKEIVPAENN